MSRKFHDRLDASFSAKQLAAYWPISQLDFFEKFSLKKVLYIETGIVLPSYRGQGLPEKMGEICLELAGSDVTVFLSETQIPFETWVDREEEFTTPASNEIILKKTVDNGFLCLLVLFFQIPPVKSKM